MSTINNNCWRAITKICTLFLIFNFWIYSVNVLYSAESQFDFDIPVAPSDSSDFLKNETIEPIFILYFPDGTKTDEVSNWISGNSEKLASVLSLPKIDGRPYIFEFNSRGTSVKVGNVDLDMYGLIGKAIAHGNPIVMIVGGDSAGGFTELTNNPMLPPASIHTAILLDPKVGTGISETQASGIFARGKNLVAKGYNAIMKTHPTINYSAIQNCVYNFYSKTELRLVRKFGPGKNGFIDGHSKIFNIRCFDAEKNHDVEIFTESPEGEQEIKGTVSIAALPPDLIKVIDTINQNFQVNSDLMYAINLAQVEPEEEKHLGLFINRPAEVVGNRLVNRQEGWSTTLTDITGDKERVKLQLDAEEQFDILLKTDLRNMCINATIERVFAQIHPAKGAPRGWSLSDVLSKIGPSQSRKIGPPEVLGVYVVPKADRVDVVALIKSATRSCGEWKYEAKTAQAEGEAISTSVSIEPFLEVTLGQGKDGFFYSVFKWHLNYEQANGEVKCDACASGVGQCALVSVQVNLKKDYDKFSFVVCGDVQKQNPEWLHNSDNSGSAAQYFVPKYMANESDSSETDQSSNPILNLFVGDFVLDGSDLKDWGDILGNDYLGKISVNRLTAAAIGTHDFASSSMTLWLSLIGLKTKTAFGWKFAPAVPTFGYLFCLDEVHDSPEKSNAPIPGQVHLSGKMDPNEHVKSTQGWFDVGRVRFIHLPLATDEVNTYGDDIGYAEWIWNNLRYSIAGGFAFDFAIADDFLVYLENANVAKCNDKIDFIIVYGHAPLVSAPNRHLHHKGLFNSYFSSELEGERFNNKIYLAEQILYKILTYADAYFCGHNHVYDRCELSREEEWPKSIPMVTIGLGTKLRKSDEIKNSAPQLSFRKFGTSYKITSKAFIGYGSYFNVNKDVEECFAGSHQQFLPAYLKCLYESGHDDEPAKITCQLLGRDRERERQYVLDEFTIGKIEAKQGTSAEVPKPTSVEIKSSMPAQKYDLLSSRIDDLTVQPSQTQIEVMEESPEAATPMTKPNQTIDLAQSRNVLQRPMAASQAESTIGIEGPETASTTTSPSTPNVPNEDELIILIENAGLALSGGLVVEASLVSNEDRMKELILQAVSDAKLQDKLIKKTTENNLNFLDIIIRSIYKFKCLKGIKYSNEKNYYQGEGDGLWVELLNLVLNWDRFKGKTAWGVMRGLSSSCNTWTSGMMLRWLWLKNYSSKLKFWGSPELIPITTTSLVPLVEGATP